MPPLGDPCGLSWGFAALRGLGPGGPGRLLVSVQPVGVSTPIGWSSIEPVARPKPNSGPPCAFAPLQRRTPAAPQRSVAPPARRPGDCPAMLPLLGFGALRHDLRSVDARTRAADPSATACRVRGLATSFAASTTNPTGARSAGASMGFVLQGVPLDARGAPLGVLALLTLPAAPPPEGSEASPTAFRASCPRRIRAAAAFPKKRSRRCLLGLLPSRAFSPSVRATACSHDAGPLVLRGDDVPTHLDLRASRIEWIGLSVSGLPALLGFRTLRPSRRSVPGPGARAQGFTSRRPPRKRGSDRDLNSLGDAAIEDPRPPTRRRRPSVLD
jgi:hypothetical protein